jgi:protein FAM50
LEKQRELERKRIQDLKKKSAEGQSGLLQFGSGTSEVSMLSSLPYLSLATKKSYYQSFMNIFSPPNKLVFAGDFPVLVASFLRAGNGES